MRFRKLRLPPTPLLTGREAARWLLWGCLSVCATVATAESVAAPSGEASEAGADRTGRFSRWWDSNREVHVLETSPHFSETESVPDDGTLEAAGAVVGEIYIQRNNVFDPSHPEENKTLFNIANKLHIRTREQVIARKLLFRTGEPYSRRVLDETERTLRAAEYLYDAWIGPLRVRGNTVDILVVTRDVWTLGVSAGLERSGGENTFSFEIQDSNFLGSGRFLTLKYEDDPERTSYRFRFHDTALFGTRGEFRLLFADNSDGYRRTIDLERPFYSLDTRWSAGTRVVNDDRITKIYHKAKVRQVFRQQVEEYSLFGGLSKGYRDGITQRMTFGYSFEKHRYDRDEDQDPNPDRPTPLWFDRVISYPWIGYERISDNFVEAHNLDQMSRTEDLNLGTEFRFRLGYSAEALGADTNQLILATNYHIGIQRHPKELILFDFTGEGRWNRDESEGVHAGFRVEYYRRNFKRFQFYGLASFDANWNPDRETQLLLGGDTGLRGYPRNYQAGTRKFLVTLEQRYYSDLHLFHLFYVGGAAFVDFGRAWFTHGRFEDDDEGVLKNIGLGLRLSSSRSSQGKMIHLDVAFPLDGKHDSVQWLITSRESF